MKENIAKKRSPNLNRVLLFLFHVLQKHFGNKISSDVDLNPLQCGSKSRIRISLHSDLDLGNKSSDSNFYFNTQFMENIRFCLFSITF